MAVTILFVLALLCFALAAINSRTLFKLDLTALGLFFAVLAYLLDAGLLQRFTPA